MLCTAIWRSGVTVSQKRHELFTPLQADSQKHMKMTQTTTTIAIKITHYAMIQSILIK